MRGVMVARKGKDNLKWELGNKSWRETEPLKFEINIGGVFDGDLQVLGIILTKNILLDLTLRLLMSYIYIYIYIYMTLVA